MRNLKKILAMVLALIMSLSLMATAGAVDFKDAEAVEASNYRQAIEVLNTLGVFNGDQNGNFNPDSTITRAEVSAIIYRIATGDITGDGKTYSVYDNQFTDVKDTDWFAGYVSYCHNAQLIKGHADGTFGPNDPVTGYQALAMILRAVGYDKNNEFVGDNWQINTASIATTSGVLDNVKGEALGNGASRALVAEVLFRSILLNKVEWNIVKQDYDKLDAHVCDTLGLEEIVGVVMANEYADLQDDEPMDAGKTRLDVDGAAYTLDIGSELNDIGELRHAYVQNKSTVLGELTVPTTGASTVAEAANDGGEGSKVADIAKRAGLTLNESTTEYFVNFGEDWDYDSEWRIEYSVTLERSPVNNRGANLFASNYIDVSRVKWENGMEDADTVGNTEQNPYNLDKDLLWNDVGYYECDNGLDWDTGNHSGCDAADHRFIPTGDTFTKIIRAGTKITKADLKIMEGIFKAADDSWSNQQHDNGITGYVYAGSNSANTQTGNNKDLSDSMTWNNFYNEYINPGEMSYRESDNGEWLKIIDNNGDNVADYVLRTDFVMTTITRFNTNNDTYTVEYREDNASVEIPSASVSDKGHLNVGNVQVMETIKADELSINDVVMYTYIDGVYHISHPTKVTAIVDKVDKTNLTFTCGETVYDWSGIDERAVNYHDEAVDGVAGTEYNLYLDQFGYIRLYTEAEKGFALLLDAFYDTDERYSQTFKAEIWDADENKSVDWTLKSGAGFVDTRSGGGIGDSLDNRGTWTRLVEFGEFRYRPYATVNDQSVLVNQAPYFGHYVPRYFTERDADSTYTRDPFWTNVAAYTGSKDGVYTLENPEGMIANTTTYHSYEVNARNWSVTKQNMDGIKNWKDANTIGATTRIRANSDTVYYYVTRAGSSVKVEKWDGYGKYANGANTYGADRVYAITAEVPGLDSLNYYELAQVIVIEYAPRNAATRATANFALWAPFDRAYPGATYVNRSADNSTNYDPRYIYTLGLSKDGFDTGISMPIVAGNYKVRGLLNFYAYSNDGTAYLIDNDYDPSTGLPTTKRFEAHGVSAGRIVSWDGLNRDFDLNRGDERVTVANQVKEELSYDVKTWIVVPYGQSSTFGGYDLRLCSSSKHNDKAIYMYDLDGKVAAVINVTRSIEENPGNTAIKDSLEWLWTRICDEIAVAPTVSTDVTVKFYGVENNEAGKDLAITKGDTAITVSHTTAKNFKGDPIEVSGDGVKTWTVDVKVALTTGSNVYKVIIDMKNGDKLTYTLTKNAENTDKTLTNDTHTTNPDKCGIELDDGAGNYVMLGEWVKQYIPTAASATAQYLVTTNGNSLVEVNYANGKFTFEDARDEIINMENVKSVVITVTAEDGSHEGHSVLKTGAHDYLADYNAEVARVTTGYLFGNNNGTKKQVIQLPGVADEVGRANAEIQAEMDAGTTDTALSTLYTTNVNKLRTAIIAGMKADAKVLYDNTWSQNTNNGGKTCEVMGRFWDVLDYNKAYGEVDGSGKVTDTANLNELWNVFAYEMWKNQYNASEPDKSAALNSFLQLYAGSVNQTVDEAELNLAGVPDADGDGKWVYTYYNCTDRTARDNAKTNNTYTNPYAY